MCVRLESSIRIHKYIKHVFESFEKNHKLYSMFAKSGSELQLFLGGEKNLIIYRTPVWIFQLLIYEHNYIWCYYICFEIQIVLRHSPSNGHQNHEKWTSKKFMFFGVICNENHWKYVPYHFRIYFIYFHHFL